jgi:phosphoserine phosphatase RsbU/P
MDIQLRTKLSGLVWGAMLAIASVCGLLLVARDTAHEGEIQSLLFQSQRLAWERSRSAVEERLAQAIKQVSFEALLPFVAAKDKDQLQRLVPAVVQGVRIEFLDLERNQLFDSAEDFVLRQPILNVAAAREVASGKVVYGLEHLPRVGFVLFRAQGVVYDGATVGIVVASAPVAGLLNDIRDGLGGDMLLATLRGARVTEIGNNLLGSGSLPPTITTDVVDVGVGRSHTPIRTTITVLTGWNNRPVAALVNVQDMTVIERQNRKFRWTAIVIGVAGALLVSLIVELFLRAALRPLDAATQKLGRLADGDTTPDLDHVVAGNDEIGSIVRASEPLRLVVAENQILVEERTRVGEVQERMIVDAMGELASTLPPARRDEVFASIYQVSDGSGEATTLTKLAKTLSNLTAQVTQAVQTREAHARMSRELEIASRLQQSVVPKQALRHDSIKTYSTMIPAFEVGGDFYDYWALDSSKIAVCIADVSGKGVPAALFMAITRTLLRASSDRGISEDLGGFVERVNDYLSADNEQAMFVTAWLGVIDLGTGHVTYVNAGHNPPIVINSNGVAYLEPAGNMALGAMEGLPYNKGELQLEPNDALVLYTDGVTEATSMNKELFGESQLLDVLAGLSGAVAAAPEAIVRAVRRHEAGAPQADDITILAVQYTGLQQQQEEKV